MTAPWSAGSVAPKYWVETSSISLLLKLCIKDITAVLPIGRLRWYGHVQCARSCIKSVTDLLLPGPRWEGRPRKTRSECVKTDISDFGLMGLTHKTEMLGEPVFGVAWCYQPHCMGHGQHPNLKMDLMYPEHVLNWLDCGQGLLIFLLLASLWLVKWVKFEFSGHFLENTWRE